MNTHQIRQKYLEFFSTRGHAIIPPVPLVPDNDPTTLFVSSGMQPLLPYFLGQPHPKGTRVVNVQPSFRAEDIEEIGDNRHTTAFEMLGNWSFGDYFKKEQLPWFFEFLTDVLHLDPARLYVTVFMGDATLGIAKDDESILLWKELFASKGIAAKDVVIGSEAQGYVDGMQGARIFAYDAKKNWWSRAGVPSQMPSGEPGGPDSEVFYDFGTAHDPKWGKECHPNCDCGRFMEIGNSVFMQYVKNADGSFSKLPKANVDFGGGLERIAAAAMGVDDVFRIDSLYGSIQALEATSGASYTDPVLQASFRIVADHMKGAIFMIADGVLPGNTEQGYVLRRLLRRSIRHMDMIGAVSSVVTIITKNIVDAYKDAYPRLADAHTIILSTILEEEERFRKTLAAGLKEFSKLSAYAISGADAFMLFSTYGFPIELTLELARERGVVVDTDEYKVEMLKHQELSRVGAEQKFKGGLADHGEKTVHYHTATHLLLAGLRKELGDHVHQAGSNITGERLRFDFTHSTKVESDVLRRVESFVNNAINTGAVVNTEVISKEDARKDPSIEGSFWEKYPDQVNVYTVTGTDGTIFSRELCGGPHVENTRGMGTFTIVKEEAVAAGIRRIKATLS